MEAGERRDGRFISLEHQCRLWSRRGSFSYTRCCEWKRKREAPLTEDNRTLSRVASQLFGTVVVNVALLCDLWS